MTRPTTDGDTPCDHGLTLAAYVETCAECGDEVLRRPPQEAELRTRLSEQEVELERLREHAKTVDAQWSDRFRRERAGLERVIADLRAQLEGDSK